MGIWTNKVHDTVLDDAEDLAYPPSGGRIKMWLLGVGLALLPLGYGIYCLQTRQAVLWGQNQDLEVTGSGAIALAIAYMAVGGFMHAHCFWGMQPRFAVVSYLLKFLSVLVFLGGLGFAMYKVVA